MGHGRAVTLITAATLIAGFTACATMFGREDTLAYSHAQHLNEDVSCLDCHVGVDKATTLAQSFIPSHEGCDSCHDKAQMDNCALCHSDEKQARRSTPDTGLIFSHAQHMEPVRGNCVRCHYDVTSAKTVAETKAPPMDACGGSCHGDLIAELRCNACHENLSRYPLDAIKFVTHGPDFERTHRRTARRDADTCQLCHDRNYCADCHSGTSIVTVATRLAEQTTRGFIHPEPYLAMHSLDARSKRDTCQTCHRPSFCASCHASVGLSTLTNLRQAPHPPGWLDPLSMKFHGTEARRSINSCATCHDRGAASVCVRCHQVGGTGGNPHPPGWKRRVSPGNNRMCRTCHWSNR